MQAAAAAMGAGPGGAAAGLAPAAASGAGGAAAAAAGGAEGMPTPSMEQMMGIASNPAMVEMSLKMLKGMDEDSVVQVGRAGGRARLRPPRCVLP